MAAVLCEAIGQVCSALYDCTAEVLRVPCMLCGDTIASVCDVLRGDFGCFIVFGLILNGLPVHFVVSAVRASEESGCEKDWMFVDLFFCAVNIVAAFYLAKEIQHSGGERPPSLASASTGYSAIPTAFAKVVNDESTAHEIGRKNKSTAQTLIGCVKKPSCCSDPEEPVNPVITSGDSASGYLDRAKYVLCFDPWIAMYILTFVGFSAWQFYGIGKASGGIGAGCELVESQIVNCYVSGMLFVFLGPPLLLCTLCKGAFCSN